MCVCLGEGKGEGLQKKTQLRGEASPGGEGFKQREVGCHKRDEGDFTGGVKLQRNYDQNLIN